MKFDSPSPGTKFDLVGKVTGKVIGKLITFSEEPLVKTESQLRLS